MRVGVSILCRYGTRDHLYYENNMNLVFDLLCSSHTI